MTKAIPTFAEFRKDNIDRRNLTVAWFEARPEMIDLARELVGENAAVSAIWKYMATYYGFPYKQSAFRTGLRNIGVLK